jgi:hypothetical protein
VVNCSPSESSRRSALHSTSVAAPTPALRARLQLPGSCLAKSCRSKSESPTQTWLLRRCGQCKSMASTQAGAERHRCVSTACHAGRISLERTPQQLRGSVKPLKMHCMAHCTTIGVRAEEHLDWLGARIGCLRSSAAAGSAPCVARSCTLPVASAWHQKAGLQLALDIASGGGVRGGEIIVLRISVCAAFWRRCSRRSQ